MKAIFKGSAGSECLVKRNFTVGKEYVLEDAKFGFYTTKDNEGKTLIFQNGVDYTFDLVDVSKLVKPELTTKNLMPSLKFYINGFAVSLEEFDNVKSAVSDLDKDGVKCDTIKFEVKFE